MPNLGVINHGNQKNFFEFLSLNQKGKADIKEKRKRREIVPPKTKLKREKILWNSKSLERKNAEQQWQEREREREKREKRERERERESKEREEKLSGFKS